METLSDYIAHLRDELASLPPLSDALSQDQRDALADALESAERMLSEPTHDDALKAAVLSGIGYGAYLVMKNAASTIRDGNGLFFQRKRGGRGKRNADLPANDILRREVAELKARYPARTLRSCREEVAKRYSARGSTIEKRLGTKKG